MGKWKNYLNAEQINPVIVSQLSIVDNTTLAPPVARDDLNQKQTLHPPTMNSGDPHLSTLCPSLPWLTGMTQGTGGHSSLNI